MHISLLDGGQPWRRECARLPIRIGRNALNDCQVVQHFISDFHARVEDIDGRTCVVDLASKNGVYVLKGGAPTRLAPNVPVDLAPYGFQFFLGPLMRVQLQVVEGVEPRLKRPPSAFGGSVLGNAQLLREGATPPPGAHTPNPHGTPPARGPSGYPPQPGAYQGAPAPPGAPFPGGNAPAALPHLRPVGALPPLGGRSLARGGPAAIPPADPYGASPPAGDPRYADPGHGNRGTGIYTMSPEQLALVGIRELAASLVPGQPLQTTGDIARLITKLHDAVEMFCRCFIPLREGYAQFISSMDLQRAAMARSRNRSRGYMAVEEARDPSAVAVALLDWRDNSLDAPGAVENIFADLMRHQVALLDGVMRGVRSLLDELSPENIERSVGGAGRGPLGIQLSGQRYKALWEAYCQRFEELSEESQAFSHIFGNEFTEAYRQGRPSEAPRRGGGGGER